MVKKINKIISPMSNDNERSQLVEVSVGGDVKAGAATNTGAYPPILTTPLTPEGANSIAVGIGGSKEAGTEKVKFKASKLVDVAAPNI